VSLSLTTALQSSPLSYFLTLLSRQCRLGQVWRHCCSDHGLQAQGSRGKERLCRKSHFVDPLQNLTNVSLTTPEPHLGDLRLVHVDREFPPSISCVSIAYFLPSFNSHSTRVSSRRSSSRRRRASRSKSFRARSRRTSSRPRRLRNALSADRIRWNRTGRDEALGG
jgi:hypothetical protein